MTIRIEIYCETDGLDEHMKELGFMRRPTVPADTWGGALKMQAEIFAKQSQLKVRDAGENSDEEHSGATRDPHVSAEELPYRVTIDIDPKDVPVLDKTVKEINEEPTKRKRRTKGEMAADEAVAAGKPPIVKQSIAESLISTGEERIDPAVSAQDAADEAAEKQPGPLTRDDVRKAVQRWTKIVGPAHAVKSLTTVLGCKMEDIPEAPEAFAQAIEKLDWAAANPALNAPPIEEKPPAPTLLEPSLFPDHENPAQPHATKDDVTEAAKAYAKKFDPAKDPAEMLITREDIGKLLSKVFGAGVTSPGKIAGSPENYGKALALVNAAVRDNPFKRALA